MGDIVQKTDNEREHGLCQTQTVSPDNALVTYWVRQGDRALILAQRLLQVITHSPEIEEDMALSNLALDLIGQARTLYTFAGEAEGRTEDDYAYWRDPHEFANPLLVEIPNGDFGQVIARQFLHDAYAYAYWQATTASADPSLAALAGKAVKETEYHLRHARSWLVRLGDGTPESHERMQRGIDELWRYTDELFEHDAVEDELIAAGIAPDPAALRAAWNQTVDDAFAEATLIRPADRPSDDSPNRTRQGGRTGHHTESFSYLIGELQVVARAHPGASW